MSANELDLAAAVMKAQREEIERLREALEKIRDEKVSNLSVCFVMRDIADTALDVKATK